MDKKEAKVIYKSIEKAILELIKHKYEYLAKSRLTKEQKRFLNVIQKEIRNLNKFEDEELIGLLRPRKSMTYSEFREFMYEDFKKASAGKKKHALGVIVYKEHNNFLKPAWRKLDSRSYVVSSNNKVYDPCAGGHSLFGTSLDCKDELVRLERIGWDIEYCYIMRP